VDEGHAKDGHSDGSHRRTTLADGRWWIGSGGRSRGRGLGDGGGDSNRQGCDKYFHRLHDLFLLVRKLPFRIPLWIVRPSPGYRLKARKAHSFVLDLVA
jgi:hypothetical protein